MSKERRAWLYEYIKNNPDDPINVLNFDLLSKYELSFFSDNKGGLKGIKDLGRQFSYMYKEGLLNRFVQGREYYNGLPKWYYEYTLR